MKKVIVSMLSVAGLAGIANAQAYPIESQLRFEVWNGASWASNANAVAGQQIEFRAVVNYTGTATDVTAMGEILYQPIFDHADNSGAGAQQDQIADLIYASGFGIAGSLLSQADGADGNPRPVSGTNTDSVGYGRCNFGQTGMSGTTTGLSAFRHSAGSNGAPAGEWLRIAGASVSTWPVFPLNTVALATATNINLIKRGVSANQLSANLTGSNHLPGTQGLIVFRGAIILSDDPAARTMAINSKFDFLNRDGSTSNADDDRYMTWQKGAADNGTYKVGVEFVPATITVAVPTPGAAALLGLGGLVAIRRRRA